MSYENDLDFEKPMKSLFDIGKKISDNVYTGNRPTATKSQMDDFVVVSIGGNLESKVYGGGYGNIPAYCSFEIYVRLKSEGVENITKMNSICQSLLRMFPISNGILIASRPKILLKGTDGLGFSGTIIRADLSIK